MGVGGGAEPIKLIPGVGAYRLACEGDCRGGCVGGGALSGAPMGVICGDWNGVACKNDDAGGGGTCC